MREVSAALIIMFKRTVDVLRQVKNAERGIALSLWRESFVVQGRAWAEGDPNVSRDLHKQSYALFRRAKSRYEAAEQMLIPEFSDN